MSTIIRDALLEAFDDEVGPTRRYLESVPEDRLDWKPHERSMSLAQLAGHLAESPGWARGMLEADFDLAALDAQGYQPFVPGSRQELLRNLDENVAAFREVLAAHDDDFFQQTWTMRMGDQVVMSAPRHLALRRTGIHHWIHHRGQLSVYLRELGVPLPPVYGPTADDARFGPPDAAGADG